MFSECDAVLVLHTEQDKGVALKYLTGYTGDFAYGVFFKKKGKKPIVFVSSLEEIPKSKTILYKQLTKRGQVKELLQKEKIKTLGLCFSEVSKSTYDTLKKAFRGVKFVDVSAAIDKKRQIKTEEEINHIKKAVHLTEQLIEEAKEQLKTARYEKEVVQFLLKRMIELEVKPSFPPIIATGWHSHAPHYQPTDRSLVLKGFCIIDMGVMYEGYCADLSRTVYIGTPNEKEIKQYQQIQHELYVLENHLHAGVKEIETSFEMIHALGHGIGRVVHERPYLGHDILRNGMCIAMEPARYFAKSGIRIEDNYLVQKKGLIRLSKSSRKLETLKRK